MIEFNPDGSVKLPERLVKKKQEDSAKLKTQRCIKVKKAVVNFTAPKKCVLHITLSDFINDNRFVENIYSFFKQNAAVPTKITKIDEKNFDVEVGTDFRRCSDCTSLVNRYREFLDGNLIEEKGSCTFEGRKKDFCYEDHFE
ncbi:hypothetical protein KY331_03680 [Candidatus Woesearchaeota archaeon]|nr:hypothetical protein [Candidatus Woesearchaeota archaeon]